MIVEDLEPKRSTFKSEVLDGLLKSPKELPCKYFYDERGSQLFDQICELDEYYPTRTELAIMHDRIGDIVNQLGARCMLIEYGSGSSLKTRVLLDHLVDPCAYVPLDISREHLISSVQSLMDEYPEIDILPVCADYTSDYAVPEPEETPARRVVYFPGSTIGNFSPAEARKFLCHIAAVCGTGGGLLIGVDLKKDRQILERAYNDTPGVTAEFNMNLLSRINHELGANFPLDRFFHRAHYNRDEGRIEMHLISRNACSVSMGDRNFDFRAGESIRTECSYKYSMDEFRELASSAGFEVQKVWTDALPLFSIQYLTVV